MTALPGIVIVVLCAVWVYVDARRLKVSPNGRSGAVGFTIGTAVLWLFVFPYYLVYRRRFVEGTTPTLAGAGQVDPATGQSGPGWYPDPQRADSIRHWDGSVWGPPAPAPSAPKPMSTQGAWVRALGITAVLLLVIIAGGVAVAKATQQINTTQVAQLLEAHFDPLIGGGQHEVDCPSREALRSGVVFDCTVRVGGNYRVIQVDETGGGRFTYVLTSQTVTQPAGSASSVTTSG